MINGAVEIFGGVPGRHLDPLLLAQSQGGESFGFIVISYNPGSVSDLSPGDNNRKFYDLFFLRGPKIYECARLNRDLRFKLNIQTALQTFKENRAGNDTQLHLYRAPEEIIHRFRSTFYYEPCLKVHIEGLTKQQIISLLKNSRCQQGIIECNEFTKPKPDIHLIEIQSLSQISNFRPSLQHGRLMLYDIVKNKEIIRERYGTCAIPTNFTKQRAGKINAAMSIPPAFGGTKLVDNSWSGTGDAGAQVIRHENGLIPVSTGAFQEIQSPASAAQIRMINRKRPRDRVIGIPTDDRPIIEADEYSMFIRQILDSPLSKDQTPSSQPALRDPACRSTRGEPSTIISRSRRSYTKKPVGNPPPIRADADPQIVSKAADQSSEYVYLFERLFRSFRQQVFESFGAKCEEVISQAEHKVRFLVPEFDCHSLKEETALSLFGLIEEIVGRASIFKRSKLRHAAVTLISDLYNKQYELLEKHHAIDAIEQTYYRLRK